MISIILGIIELILGIMLSKIFSEDKKHIQSRIALFGSIILCVALVVAACTTSIPTGYTGIITTFGKVEDTTLDAGIHLTKPWQSIVKMDNRVQKNTVNLSCFSSDLQEVSCVYTLNYQISKLNAQTIYREIGKQYFRTVIQPCITESVKTVMAHYTAEDLIGHRDKLAKEIEDLLEEELKKSNIELVSTAIEDMDFTDLYTNAIESKQVAAQNKLKAQTEQEQKTMEAQQAAERAKIEAETAAEVAKIQAQADLEVQKINADAAEYTGQKEAAKNKAISATLTKDLIEYFKIQQWNGEYPTTYMGANDVSTLIGIE